MMTQMKTVLNRLFSISVDRLKIGLQSLRTYINKQLPNHLSVEILYQINQIVGFILVPIVYFMSRILSLIWPGAVNLTFISIVAIYTWVLLDKNAPFCFLRFNSLV